MPKIPDFSTPITASEALRTRCLHSIINTRWIKGREERQCLNCGVIFDSTQTPAPRKPVSSSDMPSFDMLFIDPKGLKLAEEALDQVRQHPPEEKLVPQRGMKKLAAKKRR